MTTLPSGNQPTGRESGEHTTVMFASFLERQSESLSQQVRLRALRVVAGCSLAKVAALAETSAQAIGGGLRNSSLSDFVSNFG